MSLENKKCDLAELVKSQWSSLYLTGNTARSSKILNFQNSLRNTKNQGFALFGGAIRDWVFNRKPRDIDIVVHTSEFNKLIEGLDREQNTFGGDVVTIDGITFDIWNLPETSFIKRGKLPLEWETLIRMVPFNVSAIIVVADGWTSTNPKDINRVHVYDNGFFEAMESKTIRFVNALHPEPYRVAHRALCLSERYEFGLSYEVKLYVDQHISKEQQGKIRQSARADREDRIFRRKLKPIKSSNRVPTPSSNDTAGKLEQGKGNNGIDDLLSMFPADLLSMFPAANPVVIAPITKSSNSIPF